MKAFYFTIIACFWISLASAQRIDHVNIELNSGLFFPKIKDLNAEFKTNYNQDFGNYLVVLGGSLTSNLAIKLGKKATSSFDQITFSYLYPSDIRVDDSLSFSLKGYQVGLCFTGIDIFAKSRVFDLLVGVGTNFGRMRLNRDDKRLDSEPHKYTNPFWASKIVVEPTVYLWRIVLGIRAEYILDFGSGSWKHKDDRLPGIPTSKASGFMVIGKLGFNLVGKK